LSQNKIKNFTISSQNCCNKLIYPSLKHRYNSEQECFDDRVNCRSEWFNIISNYNKDDKAKLGTQILSEYDVYCGIRNKEELEPIRHLADHVIWVDRSNFLEPEPITSMNITSDMCDFFLDNNSTLEDLKDRVLHILSTEIKL
jgi:hypothetical protein